MTPNHGRAPPNTGDNEIYFSVACSARRLLSHSISALLYQGEVSSNYTAHCSVHTPNTAIVISHLEPRK